MQINYLSSKLFWNNTHSSLQVKAKLMLFSEVAHILNVQVHYFLVPVIVCCTHET